MDWQPIETLPTKVVHDEHNSEWVLVWVPDKWGGFPIVGLLDSGTWLYRNDERECGEFENDPTHWMPLPEPPSGK